MMIYPTDLSPRTDETRHVARSLYMNPCFLVTSSGQALRYCEKRVATYGCMVSSAFCTAVAAVVLIWSLATRAQQPWPTRYLGALLSVIASKPRWNDPDEY